MGSWLITGAAGFIGSHFARHSFYNSDASLLLLDSLAYSGDWSRVADLKQESRVRVL